MKVVLLAGMPGSGKSAAMVIIKKRAIPVYRMGDAIWAEVKARGLQLEDGAVGRIASEMRETHGPDIWAQRTVQMVRKGPKAELVFIDGCRSNAEVERFRRDFGEDLMVVAITASTEKRFERLRERKREDDVATLEAFKDRDRRELEWGLAEVIENADITIENEGPVEDLNTSMEALLQGLGG